MRIVVALGGNALLRRGQPLTAENQRANVRVAARQLAPLAAHHELVVSHGNGPQVGLLALQGAAYEEVETYPLDVLGAQTEGMIGYLIEQELGNLLPFEKPFASILTMVEVDPADPAFANPTKPIGPVYEKAEAERLAGEKGWVIKPDGDKWRRVVPSPQPQRIFEIRPIRWLLDAGAVVICTGGGGIPCMYEPGSRTLTGAEAVIDKDRASELLARELEADLFVMAPTRTRSTSNGAHRSRKRSATRHRPSCGSMTSPRGPWARRWRPRPRSSRRPAGPRRSGRWPTWRGSWRATQARSSSPTLRPDRVGTVALQRSSAGWRRYGLRSEGRSDRPAGPRSRRRSAYSAYRPTSSNVTVPAGARSVTREPGQHQVVPRRRRSER